LDFEWEDQKISVEGVGKDLDCGFGEGRRVGAMKESVDVITHDIVGEARGAIEFVIWNVCVFVGKVRVQKDYDCKDAIMKSYIVVKYEGTSKWNYKKIHMSI